MSGTAASTWRVTSGTTRRNGSPRSTASGPGRGEYHPYWDLVDAVGMLDLVGPESGWLPALDDFVTRAVARL